MKRLAIIAVLLGAACASPPPPEPSAAPPAAPAPSSAPGEERALGSVRVSASMLNVRASASTDGEVVSHVRRGERLTLLEDAGAWLRVRTGDGTVGWVSAQHVSREGAAARPRGNCPPDADYSFVKAPVPSFSDSNTAHGIVVVEAGVDVKGNVVSTRVVSNSTGDPTLATLTERELRAARFAPPVRNCVAKAFIYTYKRSF